VTSHLVLASLSRKRPGEAASIYSAVLPIGAGSLPQIYTHVEEAARLDAITKLNKLLGGTG
jgi:hypothetical protein